MNQIKEQTYTIWTSDFWTHADALKNGPDYVYEDEAKNPCSVDDEGIMVDAEGREVIDDERLQEEIYDLLDCEKMNLDVSIPEPIIFTGTVGRWNGRCPMFWTSKKHTDNSYKSHLNEIFEVMSAASSCEDFDFEISKDESSEWQVQIVCHHHDSSHHLIARAFTGSDEDFEDLLMGEFGVKEVNSERWLRKYTRSIAPDVAKIYGWELV